jgi:hypothetical protein
MRSIAACLIVFTGVMIASPVLAETCSLAVVHCKQQGIRHSDREEKCAAAGAECMRSGTFTGPYTGRTFHGFSKR